MVYVQAMAKTCDIPSLEIFRSGNYGAKGTYSDSDLTAIASAYDPGHHEAPATVDHKQEGPAFGWVNRVWSKGGSLYASLKGVPEAFAEAVRDGAFKKRSVEIYDDLAGKGRYLKAVSFLGAAAPHVKGMEDPQFSDGLRSVTFSEDEAKFIDFEHGPITRDILTSTVTGHWHTAHIDNDGNGMTDPGPDGHVHSIEGGAVAAAGSPDHTHGLQAEPDPAAAPVVPVAEAALMRSGGVFVKFGAALARLMANQIADQETEENPRSAIISRIASEAGIEEGTVNQIVDGEIDCPPMNRLMGIADALGIAESSVVEAAREDGCNVDGDEESEEMKEGLKMKPIKIAKFMELDVKAVISWLVENDMLTEEEAQRAIGALVLDEAQAAPPADMPADEGPTEEMAAMSERIKSLESANAKLVTKLADEADEKRFNAGFNKAVSERRVAPGDREREFKAFTMLAKTERVQTFGEGDTKPSAEYLDGLMARTAYSARQYSDPSNAAELMSDPQGGSMADRIAAEQRKLALDPQFKDMAPRQLYAEASKRVGYDAKAFARS